LMALSDDIGNRIKQKILAASDEHAILPAYLDSAVRRSAEDAVVRDLCEVHSAIERGLHLRLDQSFRRR
jgi:hypothetical protein